MEVYLNPYCINDNSQTNSQTPRPTRPSPVVRPDVADADAVAAFDDRDWIRNHHYHHHPARAETKQDRCAHQPRRHHCCCYQARQRVVLAQLRVRDTLSAVVAVVGVAGGALPACSHPFAILESAVVDAGADAFAAQNHSTPAAAAADAATHLQNHTSSAPCPSAAADSLHSSTAAVAHNH